MTLSSSLSAIALGGNLGPCQQTLEAALTCLDQQAGITVQARSRWYHTKAVGPPQPDYLNGCAVLQVSLTPSQLLDTLLAIETQFGRVRQERNGPRTLDLDLLLFVEPSGLGADGQDYSGAWTSIVFESPRLQIPHPRMVDRAFVLVPLAEIAPQWIEPFSGKTIEALGQTVDRTGVWL